MITHNINFTKKIHLSMIKMVKKTLYTAREYKYFNMLNSYYQKNLINHDVLERGGMFLIQKCEERKNRIRYNQITPLDEVRGFTPENFPYLTKFSKEYYPEDQWKKLQNLDKRNIKSC